MMTSIDLLAYCRTIIEDMRLPWEPPERPQPSRSLAVRHRLGTFHHRHERVGCLAIIEAFGILRGRDQRHAPEQLGG
jgi:hypothetical protein